MYKEYQEPEDLNSSPVFSVVPVTLNRSPDLSETQESLYSCIMRFKEDQMKMCVNVLV